MIVKRYCQLVARMKADARKCLLFCTVHCLLKPALSTEISPYVERNLAETGSILQKTISVLVGQSPEVKTRPLVTYDAFRRGPMLTKEQLNPKKATRPTESTDANIARLIEEISLNERVQGTNRNEVYRKILLHTLFHHKRAHQQLVDASNSTSGVSDSVIQEWLQHITGTDATQTILQDLKDGGREPLTFNMHLGQGSSPPLLSSSSSSHASSDKNGTSAERVRRNDNGMIYIPVGGTKKVQCPTAADAAGSSLIQMAFLSICLTVFSIVVNVNNNINNNNNNNNINTDNNLANNNAQLSLNVNNAAQVNVMLPPPAPGRRKREAPSFRDTWKQVKLSEAMESLPQMLERLVKEGEKRPFVDRSKNQGFGEMNSTQRTSRPTGNPSGKAISFTRNFTDRPLSPNRSNIGKSSRPTWSCDMEGSDKNYTVNIFRPTEDHEQKATRIQDLQSTTVIGDNILMKDLSVENNSSKKTKNSKTITPKRNIQSPSRSLSNFQVNKMFQGKAKKHTIALDGVNQFSQRFVRNDHNRTSGQSESDADDDIKLLKPPTTPEIALKVVKEISLWLGRLKSSNPSCLWINLCQSLQEKATRSWITLLASFVAHRKESERIGNESVTIEDFIRMAFMKQQCGLLFPLCSLSPEI